MSAAAPRFHRLTIRDLRRETADAVSIAFDVPGEFDADYRFAPGQYLTLRATIDGEDLRRSYSICSGPDDGELRIAVKRVEGGVFSDWVNRTLTAGDAIEVMTPTGRFGVPCILDRPRIHVGFAAGSGITPVLSILRGVLAREPDSRFFLFYGNRSTAEILFREALEELKDRFLGRLSVFHVLSQEEQDLPILSGRLDGDKVRRLLRLVVPAEAVDEVYLCGPEAMSREIAAVLAELGVAPEKVHVELFVSALGGRPRPKPVAPAPDAPSRTAVLTVDGKRREVPVADGESILDAALRAGMDLPYACKGGMCSTCRAKLVEGEAAMDLNYSLEPWELEAGFILTCQSHPKTDRVVVDYDQM
ncbi:ring-1,2-phenylacetyl-CoA epoxidase subunit PaaE [Inquilinus ginsengisoli]|uniref:1,2-phenylacetyl-CoA epoxidase subunit PaaE n=1 Tax=Inquilinus ginsengisoli TaxID=363840 RepID=UPI003D1E656F